MNHDRFEIRRSVGTFNGAFVRGDETKLAHP